MTLLPVELRAGESGWTLTLLAILVAPLALVAAVGLSTMHGRGSVTAERLRQERALLAAESAVDTVLHRLNAGTLVLGPLSGVLGNGNDFTADVVDTGTRYQVTATGRYLGVRRRVFAWIARNPPLPAIVAAASVQDPASVLQINGNAFSIDGTDTNIDGTPGSDPAVHGVSITEPGTVAGLLSSLTSNQKDNITGSGGTPSARTSNTPIDVPALIQQMKSIAHNVVVPGITNLGSVDWGAPSAGNWRATYVAGNLTLSGNLTGGGVIAVDGDLELSGNVSFTGVLLVRGNVRFSGGGTAKLIRGALIVGGDADIDDVVQMNGSVELQYSKQTVDAVRQLVTRFRILGWKEIARS
jgi:hypothetical protein